MNARWTMGREKRWLIACIMGLVILSLLASPALGWGAVEAKKKAPTGPGYTSPPLCCTEPQCKRGPGWSSAPALRLAGPTLRLAGPTLLPAAKTAPVGRAVMPGSKR